MIVLCQGLKWDCPSPSYYALILPAEHEAAVDVAYVGDSGKGDGWCLFMELAGEVSAQLYASRDDAIKIVANAFNREGCL